MSDHSYYLSLPGALLMRIETPVAVFESQAARTLAEAYLPGAEFVGVCSKSGTLHVCTKQPDIVVRYDDSIGSQGEPLLRVRDSRYELHDKWSGEASLMDLLFLCYGAARLAWLKRGLYPVHAAALDLGDGGLTLLVGHSGNGKTAVTLSAVSRGHKVFSGNKTLVRIDEASGGAVLTAVAGTRPMTTKAEDVERHLSTEAVKNGYQGRSAFYLEDEHYAPSSPAMVHTIILPRLNDGAQKAKVLGPVSALHKLYPYFLDTVNADIVLSGGKVVLSGNPANGVRERLSRGLASALSGDQLSQAMQPAISVKEVEGTMAFISKTLDGERS